MQLKVASWNVEGRLSDRATNDRGTPQAIIEGIIAINADIMFLPEGYMMSGIAPGVEMKLKKAGYLLHRQQYLENTLIGQENYGPVMLMLIKKSINLKIEYTENVLRLGDVREAMVMFITTQEGLRICFTGVHLHDKNEQLRLEMSVDLARFVKKQGGPVVIAGDFNAMQGSLLRSKLLRLSAFELFTRLIPHTQLKSLLRRIHEMAYGATLKYLDNETHMVNVNEQHRSTVTPKTFGFEWMPSVALIGIDHILVSSQLVSCDFKVYPDNGSDHRAISTQLSV